MRHKMIAAPPNGSCATHVGSYLANVDDKAWISPSYAAYSRHRARYRRVPGQCAAAPACDGDPGKFRKRLQQPLALPVRVSARADVKLAGAGK